MIIFGDEICGDIIAAAAGTSYNPKSDQCIARVEDGIVVGGVTYQGYTKASIGMHTAGFRDNWLNRDLLWVVFDYPFRQLGVEKVFIQIPESNRKSLEFAVNLGFKMVTRIEDVFPDGACLILSLAREDCRWLKIKPKGIVPGSGT